MNKCYDFIREGMIRQSNGDGEAIRCECGNIIGVIDNFEFVFQHRGRKIVIEGDAKATIYCERCGAETEIISKRGQFIFLTHEEAEKTLDKSEQKI